MFLLYDVDDTRYIRGYFANSRPTLDNQNSVGVN